MIIDFRGEWVGWRKFRVGVVCGFSSYYISYNGIAAQITTCNTKITEIQTGYKSYQGKSIYL